MKQFAEISIHNSFARIVKISELPVVSCPTQTTFAHLLLQLSQQNELLLIIALHGVEHAYLSVYGCVVYALGFFDIHAAVLNGGGYLPQVVAYHRLHEVGGNCVIGKGNLLNLFKISFYLCEPASVEVPKFITSSHQPSLSINKTGTNTKSAQRILPNNIKTFVFVVDFQQSKTFHPLGYEYLLPIYMDGTNWRQKFITNGSSDQFLFIYVKKEQFLTYTHQQFIEICIHRQRRVVQLEVEEMVYCHFALITLERIDSDGWESALGECYELIFAVWNLRCWKISVAIAAAKTKIIFVIFFFITQIGQ